MQASRQLNSTWSFSSKLLKLSFCDPYPAAPNQEKNNRVLTEVEEDKNNLRKVEIL